VAWLSAVTLAPLTTAPEGSETKPLMLPLPAWANATEPAQRKRMQTERKFRAVLTIAFLLFINGLLTQSRKATFNSAGVVMHCAGDRASVPSSKAAEYLY
jgi:hypothetical protein